MSFEPVAASLRSLPWQRADGSPPLGTFSTVYKAIDLKHDEFKNEQWETRITRKPNKPVYVALKRIYVTSSPQRILNEIDIMVNLR